MPPNEQEIAQQKFKETYVMGVKKPTSFVFEVPENKHGIDNPVQDLDVGAQKISGNVTFDGSAIVSPPVVITLQNQDGVMALQNATTLTDTLLVFANSTGLLVQDADLSFATDTLSATKLKSSSLTAGRVPIVSTGGLIIDDADMTFATDTLTVTKVSAAFNGTLGATTPATAVITTLNITSFGANWTNAGRTVADMGVVTTIDINGGSIDGTTIGAAAPSSGIFTSLQADTLTNDTGLAAGVYTPTDSAHVNIDGSDVTMTEAQYMRVGNTVTVSGQFTADPTAPGAASFEITLPVASNIGAVEDVSGVACGGGVAALSAQIIGVVANDTAKIQWIAVDLTSQSWSYTLTYQVI